MNTGSERKVKLQDLENSNLQIVPNSHASEGKNRKMGQENAWLSSWFRGQRFRFLTSTRGTGCS